MIATLSREILLPRRVEFPAWVRKLGDPLRMFGHGAFGTPFAQPMGGAGAAAGPTTLLSDSFTGANGTQLHNRALDVGGTWTSTGTAADWTIQTNRAFRVNTSFLIVDSGYSDFTLSVRVIDGTEPPSGDAGGKRIVFRYQNTTNYWFVEWGAAAAMELREVTSGTNTLRVSYNYSAGRFSPVKIVCSGTSIKVYESSTERISYTSSSHQSDTIVGFWSNRGGTYYDDFLVTTP